MLLILSSPSDDMLDGCPEYDTMAKYVKYFMCIPEAPEAEGDRCFERCVSVSMAVSIRVVLKIETSGYCIDFRIFFFFHSCMVG